MAWPGLDENRTVLDSAAAHVSDHNILHVEANDHHAVDVGDRYVLNAAQGGSDSNSGLSWADAMATPHAAYSDLAGGSDPFKQGRIIMGPGIWKFDTPLIIKGYTQILGAGTGPTSTAGLAGETHIEPSDTFTPTTSPLIYCDGVPGTYASPSSEWWHYGIIRGMSFKPHKGAGAIAAIGVNKMGETSKIEDILVLFGDYGIILFGAVAPGNVQNVTLNGQERGAFWIKSTGAGIISIYSPSGDAQSVKAKGTLTVTTATNNETVTINDRTYTWKTTLTGAANEVAIGGSDAQARLNLVAAMRDVGTEGVNYGTGTAKHATVQPALAGFAGGSTCVMRAELGGLTGNGYAFSAGTGMSVDAAFLGTTEAGGPAPYFLVENLSTLNVFGQKTEDPNNLTGGPNPVYLCRNTTGVNTAWPAINVYGGGTNFSPAAGAAFVRFETTGGATRTDAHINLHGVTMYDFDYIWDDPLHNGTAKTVAAGSGSNANRGVNAIWGSGLEAASDFSNTTRADPGIWIGAGFLCVLANGDLKYIGPTQDTTLASG